MGHRYVWVFQHTVYTGQWAGLIQGSDLMSLHLVELELTYYRQTWYLTNLPH